MKAVNESSGEPVSLDLAKSHCRIDGTADDSLVEQVYIPAARQTVEQYTGRQIIPIPVTDVLTGVASGTNVLVLRWMPASDLESIVAVDADGGRANLDLEEYGARVVTGAMVATVVTSKALPSARFFEAAYSAGYASGTCPPNLVLAILEFVGDAYENREAQQSQATLSRNPRAVELMDPFRLTFGI